MDANQELSIRIGKRVFLVAVAVLAVLMAAAGVAGRLLPAGAYDQQQIDGRMTIIPGTYHPTDTAPLPLWRWLTAPVEVLGSDDGLTIIVIIVFLFFLAGSFSALTEAGILQFAIGGLARRFERRKYLLLWVVSLFFMALGSFMGIFEETVLLAPVAVALCIGLGFDAFTGLAVSLLATGFGFSAGVSNPFTTGVAQQLAGLPLFSGAGYRMILFIVVYLVMMAFTIFHARRVERKTDTLTLPPVAHPQNARRGLLVFGVFFALIVLWIAVAGRMDGLSDYTMPALAVLFLLGGIAAGIASRLGGARLGRALLGGMGGVAPGVLLILMASSVKFIMKESGVLDTILHSAEQAMGNLGPVPASLSIYLLVLVLEFFIGSGSAKAFLVIPLISPLTSLVGLSSQTAVLAFLCGDGFANVFYITNPVLLITLGITGMSYGAWFRRTALLQLIVLLVTAGMVALASVIGY